jgi:hypothetical protein
MRRHNIDEYRLIDRGTMRAAALARFRMIAGERPLPAYDHTRALSGREKDDCEASIVALDALRAGLGLPPCVIDRDMIGIADSDLYRASNPNSTGSMYYGHVYLTPQNDRTEFLATLTHELVHAAAWNRIDVIAEDSPHFLVAGTCMRRTGYRVQRGIAAAYNGFNEAVTELIAHEVRLRLLMRPHDLDDEAARRLAVRFSYPATVILVDGLIGARPELRRGLYRDYFAGSYDTVREIGHAFPGSLKRLARLDRTATGAAKVARDLGLADTLLKLAPLIA